MIDVAQAQQQVDEHTGSSAVVTVEMSSALGMTLAEDVTSDVDSPPHDKAMVDGYAVVAADLTSGEAELVVLEEVTAGEVPTKEVRPGCATRIMTGAPVPVGAGAVVMIEQTELVDESRVRIRVEAVRPQMNIMARATALRRGEVVLSVGTTIQSLEIALLAEVGRGQVQVVRRPTVAILATGDELVPPDTKPAAGQIRNSNGPMLAALVREAGGEPIELAIGRDDEAALTELVTQGLEADLLVLSGGVSAGVLDLVPKVLDDLGVRQVFHKVRLKPGKPVWLGVQGEGERLTPVFGLPGNPLGTFVGFQLFVRRTIAARNGRTELGLPQRQAALADDFQQRGDRPTYFPALLSDGPSGAIVRLLPWQGSADIRGATTANCLAIFSAGSKMFGAGELIEVLVF